MTNNYNYNLPFLSLVDLIDSNLLDRSDVRSIIFNDSYITYHQLIAESDRLANYLKSLGISKGDIVAVCLERSPKLIIALLAILKTGAAYLPLDPEYPKDRIEFMVEDSGAKTFITQTRFENKFDTLIPKLIEEEIWPELDEYSSQQNSKIEAADLAYILYTSGSTGKPKGVQIEHGALSNFLFSVQKSPGITPDDILLATTTVSFDIAGLEIFLPLISGAQLVLTNSKESRNGFALLNLIKKHHITLMQATPATWKMLLASGWNDRLPIKILCGGEPLSEKLANTLIPLCNELWNMYGPTETTIWSSIKKIQNSREITIGNPIDATQFYIVSEQLNTLGIEEIGEIAIGGAGLARGYLNREELTLERFVYLNNDGKRERIYLTGDLGYLNHENEYVCLGRKDDQVKINGHRIELQEIESTLNQLPAVKESLILAIEDEHETQKLAAYIIEGPNFNKKEAILYLQSKLPDYMVPRIFITIANFPLTANGKIDKKQLPDLSNTSRIDSIYISPNNQVEKQLQEIWSAVLHLEKKVISIDHNFFELGGTSLLAHEIVQRLSTYQINISPTKIYQYPTIQQLSNYIHGKKTSRGNASARIQQASNQNQEIAVIGMAVRVPGADTLERFWENLKNGKESIRFFNDDELDPSISTNLTNKANYVKARGIIEDVDKFDASFFGITPRSAQMMDPQQRIFLELSWEALEHAGYTNPGKTRSVGVFAGCSHNSYFTKNILHYPDLIDQMGEFQVTTLNDKDYLSSRTAYALNLQGPAVTVQSACSTSLLAIGQAVESIRKGQCSMALAGGIAINPPVKSGHSYQEGAIFSKDGHCKPFDAHATGTLFSDGGGVVVLKNKDQAIKDGDTIYAVIKGVGVNNDGNNKGSFTAPSAEGQAESIRMALQDGNISPGSLGYIEAHGTATPLGDPIEIEGLQLAFGDTRERQYCYIGSVKSNLGHLTVAAGVAGFIKTCLSLYHKQIPPSINFTTPNPIINFPDTPFVVANELTNWDTADIRRAGVSSFGIGGTNVHVVLEENTTETLPNQIDTRPLHLISWSAKNETSSHLYQNKLKNFLSKNSTLNIRELSVSLQLDKPDFRYRKYIIASQTDELIDKLGSDSSVKFNIAQSFSKLAFVFPGQGAQYLNMGKEIYDAEPLFKKAVDRCAEILIELIGEDIRGLLYPMSSTTTTDAKFADTRYTQLALFITEYALAKLWISWGFKPNILIGHSIGEFVAAHLAGVFTLKDALYLIATRGRLMSGLPEGNMLAVRTKDIQSILPPDLDIAAINTPNTFIISGSAEAINTFSNNLTSKGISSTRLASSKAFHSRMVDPVVDPFKLAIKNISLKSPQIPIISTVTGDLLKESEALSPAYWANHLRATVNFSAAVHTLQQEENVLAIEVGPKNTLTNLIRQHQSAHPVHVYASLSPSTFGDYHKLLDCLGSVWSAGYPVDWNKFTGKSRATHFKTPTYAFDRQSYWLEAKAAQQTREIIPASLPAKDIHPTDSDNDNNKIANQPSDATSLVIKSIIEDISGLDLSAVSNQSSFLEIGLDSLLLTQLASLLQKHFEVPISFRSLNEDLYNLNLLTEYISKHNVNNDALYSISSK